MDNPEGNSLRKRKHSDNYGDNNTSSDVKIIAGPSHASDNSAGCSSRVKSGAATSVIVSPSCSKNTGSSHDIIYISDNSDDSSSPANFDTSDVFAFPSCSYSAGPSHASDNYAGCSSRANYYRTNVIVSPSCSRNTGSSLAVTNASDKDSPSPANFDTSDFMAVPSCSHSAVLGTSQKPNCYSELPEAVMQNVYRSLSSKDLINIRDVCDSWKECTDKSSVWKHAPLCLHDRNIKELSKMPYIHTVTGLCAEIELYVNAMVNNLQDLRVLDIIFYPYITTAHVQKLVNKFVNLESIKLDPSAPNIFKTLAILKNCTKLKEVKFWEFDNPNFYNWKQFFDRFVKIKSLNTFDFYPLSQFVNSSDILYLLGLIMKRLVTLKVCIDLNTDNDIVDNISTITSKIICDGDRLETLDFSTSEVPPADTILNFAELKNLKFLKFWLQSKTHPNVLAQVTFPTSLEFLEISFSDKGLSDTQKIMQRAIESCPNLKHLNASYIEDEDINEQLEHINRLQNLHTVILEHCPYLSGQGLQYISECSKLRILKLTKASLDGASCNCLKSCKYLQEVKFEKCDINPIKLAQTKLSLERLTHLSLVQCYRKIGKKKARCSAKYLKRIL